MKIVKVNVTTQSDYRDGTKSGGQSNSYEAIYLMKGWFKKRVYYISQQYAIPVVNVSKPVEPKETEDAKDN